MVAYFERELRDVQNALIRSGMGVDKLILLNARAGALAEHYEWAKKRPRKAEAQE